MNAPTRRDLPAPRGGRRLTAAQRRTAGVLARAALADQSADRQALAGLLIDRRTWWRPGRRGGDLLGSGLGLSVPGMVEATVAAAQAVAALVAAGAAGAAGERMVSAAGTWLRRRRRAGEAAAIAATAWSPAQLAEIHRNAELAALGTGVSAAEARAIADRIVTAMVVPGTVAAPPEAATEGDEQPGED